MPVPLKSYRNTRESSSEYTLASVCLSSSNINSRSSLSATSYLHIRSLAKQLVSYLHALFAMGRLLTLITTLAMFQPCLLFLQANASNSTGNVHLWSQQEALLQWKSTLRSSLSLLDSWRPGTSPCSRNWKGVVCDAVHHGRRGMPRAVVLIDLPKAGIDGSLGELNFSALPFLQYIDLSYNSLLGEIPRSIASLAELSHLDLTGNRLHGQIPWEVGNMESL